MTPIIAISLMDHPNCSLFFLFTITQEITSFLTSNLIPQLGFANYNTLTNQLQSNKYNSKCWFSFPPIFVFSNFDMSINNGKNLPCSSASIMTELYNFINYVTKNLGEIYCLEVLHCFSFPVQEYYYQLFITHNIFNCLQKKRV